MRKLLSVSLMMLGLAQLQETVAAQAPILDCHTAQFSEAVLQRFPKVRDACLDGITREGPPYAVFKADLVRVSSKGVQIRPKLPGGAHAEARLVKVHPDRKVLV